jgi:hypothetical protein
VATVGVPKIEREKLQSKIKEILEDYNQFIASKNRIANLKSISEAEKILMLAESTSYPTVIFECLLDQIEKLQIDKRRLLFGENYDVEDAVMGDEGDVDLEFGTTLSFCFHLKFGRSIFIVFLRHFYRR